MVQMLQNYCRRRGIELRVDAVSSGEELIRRWQLHKWDVAMLDIYMDGISGVETARWLRERDRDCAMVFATTSREHGMIGYDLGVVDYLTKPIAQADVDEVMDWIIRERKSNLRLLRVRTEWEDQEVRLRDVCFVEIRNHTATVHVGANALTTRRSMEELAAEIGEEERFFRCHRSYLVNLDHVVRVEKKDFLMDNGELVPISKQNLAAAKQTLMEWVLEKNWGR